MQFIGYKIQNEHHSSEYANAFRILWPIHYFYNSKTTYNDNYYMTAKKRLYLDLESTVIIMI